MDIENKYLKYKIKYLELKNQKAGSTNSNSEIDEIKKSLEKIKEMIETQDKLQRMTNTKLKVIEDQQKYIFDMTKKNIEILAIVRRMNGEGPIMALDPALKPVPKFDFDDDDNKPKSQMM